MNMTSEIREGLRQLNERIRREKECTHGVGAGTVYSDDAVARLRAMRPR